SAFGPGAIGHGGPLSSFGQGRITDVMLRAALPRSRPDVEKVPLAGDREPGDPGSTVSGQALPRLGQQRVEPPRGQPVPGLDSVLARQERNPLLPLDRRWEDLVKAHGDQHRPRRDRKSTRLNSSHGSISYA